MSPATARERIGTAWPFGGKREGDRACRSDGTWTLTIETPIGAQESTLEAQTSGGALTGTQSSPDGSQAIQDGVVDGDEASWSVAISSPMAMTLEFKGAVDGDTMSGSVKLGMFGEAKITGVRA